MENKLPKGWEIKKLVDHVPIIKTGVENFIGDKPYYSTGSITDKEMTPEGKFKFQDRPARANRLVLEKDVVQARMKETQKALLIDKQLAGSLFSTGFLQFRPEDHGYDSKLFYYYLRSDKFLKQRDEHATGSTQVALTDDGAEKIDLIIPPENIHQRIADKLDSLLAKVKDAQSRLDTIPAILKHLKQSIFISASNPSNGDWKECTLAELCDFMGGGTPSRSNSKYWNGSIPWVSPKDMKRDRIADSQEHISDDGLKNSTSKMIPKGALLFVVRGMILNHTLPVAITDREVAINQDMKALIPKDKELSEYLFLACKAASMQILFYVKEATHGTRRIETDLLKDWKVYVPPKESVKAIVEKARRNMTAVDALEKKFVGALKYTDKLEQSILAKAFRGELVA
ncbi:MAG: restriction endonuclease subunit S [Candidatus Omnitrophota bacterium]